MSVVLCVRLWANPGEERALVTYEDAVLALLPEHGARVVARVRAEQGDGGSAEDSQPFETQIIELPDQAALDAYLADPRRAAASDLRDVAIARTEIQPVQLVR